MLSIMQENIRASLPFQSQISHTTISKQQGGNVLTAEHCLAKAFYDNISESPDELSFSKGDVVTVLEQNPGGLEGWWLCSLRGRQGIAPGNRLRLIPGMYDSTGLGYAPASDVSGNNNSVNSSPSLPSTPSCMSGSRRRSWHNNSNRVVTPQRIGDVYLYDVPLGTGVTYDVPVSRQLRSSNSSPLPNQVFQSTSYSKSTNCTYDTPQSPKIVMSTDHTLTRAINNEIRCSEASNNDIAKLEAVEAYDVPVLTRKVVSDDQKCVNYDVPPPPTKLIDSELLVEICYDVPRSNRSSGIISHESSNSSLFSPSPQSNCSNLVVSTSFSSLGDSNKSSFEKPVSEVYDVPPSGNPRRIQHCTDNSYHNTKNNISSLAKGCVLNIRGTVLNNDYLNCDDDEVDSNKSAVYDTPKSVAKTSEGNKNEELHLSQRISMCSIESKDSATYSTVSNDSSKELNIDLNEGILLMVKYQQQVLGAISDLFALIVDSNWRQKEKLSNTICDLRRICHTLSCSLKELLHFANSVYINSINAFDKSLSQKMSNLLLQLTNSNAIIQNSVTAVDLKGWTVDKLASTGVATSILNSRTPDELDQLVACSRGLSEDVKHIISFIRSNAKLLFKDSIKNVSEKPPILPKPTLIRALPNVPPPAPPRNCNVQSRPLPPLPKENETKVKHKNNSPEPIVANDYEYVSLESKDSKSHKDANEAINMKESFQNIAEESGNVEIYSLPQKNVPEMEVSTYGRLCDATSLPTIDFLPAKQVPAVDRQVLIFYCAQLESHKCILGHSIDSFITAIDNNQPPKVFIERSKLVVVAALKLIYIADSIARNVNSELSSAVSKCCNCLCDYLKTLVVNTKKAALQFPSVTAVQEMVDCVVDVSHSANKLFTSLLKMSNL